MKSVYLFLFVFTSVRRDKKILRAVSLLFLHPFPTFTLIGTNIQAPFYLVTAGERCHH